MSHSLTADSKASEKQGHKKPRGNQSRGQLRARACLSYHVYAPAMKGSSRADLRSASAGTSELGLRKPPPPPPTPPPPDTPPQNHPPPPPPPAAAAAGSSHHIGGRSPEVDAAAPAVLAAAAAAAVPFPGGLSLALHPLQESAPAAPAAAPPARHAGGGSGPAGAASAPPPLAAAFPATPPPGCCWDFSDDGPSRLFDDAERSTPSAPTIRTRGHCVCTRRTTSASTSGCPRIHRKNEITSVETTGQVMRADVRRKKQCHTESVQSCSDER